MKYSLLSKQSTPIGVALIAPGGYAHDEVALARGIAILESQGCRVYNYYVSAEKHQRFGGTDAARIEQFHAAIAHPDVQIVMALRGGYGLSRLLPFLDLDALARSGKRLVGHSDCTALQLALLAKTGAVSFAGPMMCDDFTRDDVSDFTMTHLWLCLSDPHYQVEIPGAHVLDVAITGTLWGGNLSMLVHLLGTPYFPQIEGGILFLEDVNEHPYRVERMLLQLLYAGVLARQQAIVLGDFSRYQLSAYDNGYDFEAMLHYMRSVCPVPIVTGLPFGHIRDKVTLPVGCRAELVPEQDRVMLRAFALD